MVGVHYTVVAPTAAENSEPDVVEFFSYACPHCYHLESSVTQWHKKKAGTISFERVPAQWNPFFKKMGQLYYTLEVLGLSETHGHQVFDVIHKQKRSLHTDGQIKAFVMSLGVTEEVFQAAYHSDVVKNKMHKADGLFKQYKISGVPGFVIKGRYFTDMKLAGSESSLYEIIDYLLGI